MQFGSPHSLGPSMCRLYSLFGHDPPLRTRVIITSYTIVQDITYTARATVNNRGCTLTRPEHDVQMYGR